LFKNNAVQYRSVFRRKVVPSNLGYSVWTVGAI